MDWIPAFASMTELGAVLKNFSFPRSLSSCRRGVGIRPRNKALTKQC